MSGQIMQIIPIPIILDQTKRDCIVVDNKTYCRESSPPTPHEFGVLILVACLLIGYVIAVLWYGDKKDNGWIIIGGIGIPVLLVGLLLAAFG